MANHDPEKLRVQVFTESPDVALRYDRLKILGKEVFKETQVAIDGTVSQSDVGVARNFVAQGITQTNPEVWADYFIHIMIAPELGGRIARALQKDGTQIDVPTVEFLLWLHDVARLVAPGAYFRNDVIDERLLHEIGIPKELIQQVPPLQRLMETANSMNITEEQVSGGQPLTEEQKIVADQYFESLTPTQRVINLADNLGKRGEEGLFDVETFLNYLRTQEQRYDGISPWPSINWAIGRRRQGGILQAYTIQRTIQWLSESGVDIHALLDEMKDYGPEFVILVRHGNLDNSKNIVYNRDSLMDTDDVIHLSKSGIEQMQKLGNLIQRRKFRVRRILVSPETRTRESAKELNSFLQVANDKVLDDTDIDEVRASGPYHEGLTMDKWRELKGNAYDETRWGRYNHEKPEEIIQRTNKRLLEEITELQTGQASIFVSHGDPIGFLINHLVSGKILYQDDTRSDLIYPLNGEGIVLIVGPDGKLFSYYTLTDESLPEGTSF